MLIEVKTKVARIIEGKTRKKVETFLVPDCEVFTTAEYAVLHYLCDEQRCGEVSSSEIFSLKQSPIKEVYTQYTGDFPFIATLKDIFHEDDGTEKTTRYKVLLWATNPAQALSRVQELARQNYDMQIEGIKQVDYEYLDIQPDQEEETENG